jgi:F0F1-type ATP synthase alpha subunit
MPVNKVRDFEPVLLDGLRTTHPEVRKRIQETREIPADLTAKLDAAITGIRDSFLGGKARDPR